MTLSSSSRLSPAVAALKLTKGQRRLLWTLIIAADEQGLTPTLGYRTLARRVRGHRTSVRYAAAGLLRQGLVRRSAAYDWTIALERLAVTEANGYPQGGGIKPTPTTPTLTGAPPCTPRKDIYITTDNNNSNNKDYVLTSSRGASPRMLAQGDGVRGDFIRRTPSTPLRVLMRHFKQAQNVNPTDVHWNREHYRKHVRAAAQLLQVFQQDPETAGAYVRACSKRWRNLPSWTLAAVVRRANHDPQVEVWLINYERKAHNYQTRHATPPGEPNDRTHQPLAHAHHLAPRSRACYTPARNLVGYLLRSLQPTPLPPTGPPDLAGPGGAKPRLPGA